MQITKETILKALKVIIKAFYLRRIKVIENLDLDTPINLAHNQLADTLSLSDEKQNKSGHHHQVLLFTSANPKEGKTSAAVNLALTYSKRKKTVLLIDGDLRNPLVHKYLNIDQTVGLVDLLEGKEDEEKIIKETRGLWVLPAGNLKNLQSSPTELLGSEKMKTLLNKYSIEFDLVVIDSPCLKIYRDALSLGRLVDKVFLVVEANKTPKRSILMAHKKITAAQGNFAGFILNKKINRVPFFIQDILR